MGQLDLTLFTTNLVLCTLWAFTWGVLGSAMKMAPKASWRFCAANLLFAVTVVNLTHRTLEPSYLHYQGVEWLVFFGLAAFHSGISYLVRLHDMPSQARRFGPVLIAMVITLQVAPDSTSYTVRSVVFSLTVAWLTFNCFWDCFGGLRNDQYSPVARWAIGGPFLLASLVMLARAAMIMLGLAPAPSGEFAQIPHFTPFLVMLTVIVLAMNITMGILTFGRMTKRFRNLAEQDPHTGCLNRTSIEERLAFERERMRRSSAPVACVFFQVDQYRPILEQHGQAPADTALQHAVTVIQSGLRAVDSLGRIGDEEFMIVMPDTQLAGARDAANRMRQALEQTTLRFAGNAVPLTASFGAAMLGPNESLASILGRADAAMYQAKRNGRNRVEISTEPA